MSVNFIKEVDELLEVDLVAGLHARDFNHCYNRHQLKLLTV